MIDLNKKLDISMLADKNNNYYKKEGQEFYENTSGKMIHLAEQLPNGNWWFVKSWRKNSIILTN